MAIDQVTSGIIKNDAITSDKLGDNLEFQGASTKFPIHANASARNSAIGSPAAGMVIYQTDLKCLMQYNGTIWEAVSAGPAIDTVTYPSDEGVVLTALDAGSGSGTQTLLINGSGFSATVTVEILTGGSYAAFSGTTSVNGTGTVITCGNVTKRTAADGYNLRVTNDTGLKQSTTVNFSADPTWTTAADLGTVYVGDTLAKSLVGTGEGTMVVTNGSPNKPTWMTVTGTTSTADNGASDTTFNATGSPWTLGGTIANSGTAETLTFGIIIRDGQNQTLERDFSLIASDVPTGGAHIGTFAGDGTVGTSGITYRYHIFKVQGTTTSGTQGYEDITFTTYSPITLEYLAVAGGGSGASVNGAGGGGGGGGGAGGVLSNLASYGGPAITNLAAGAHTIRLGLGGASQTSSSTGGITGGDTKIISAAGSTLVHCRGGGAGGDPYGGNGGNGGSGGGAAESDGTAIGGKGVYPGSSFVNAVRQGYNGGATTVAASTAAGGGGWGAQGVNFTGGATGSAGGAGNFSYILSPANRNGIGVDSSSKLYFAGGGGGSSDTSGTHVAGGVGGGGGGGNSAPEVSGGTNHTGSGGGAGGRMPVSGSSGAGGCGVVVVRYQIN